MLLKPFLVASCSVLFLFTVPVKAQSLGLQSAFDGFGLMLQWPNSDGNETEVFSLLCDTYGVHRARTDDLGVRFSYTHNYVLYRFYNDEMELGLRLGAGVTLGYAHDNENGIFIGTQEALTQNMGFIAALCCTGGARIDFFRRRVAVDLSFCASPGVHVRRDETTGNVYVSLYKNGIYHVIYPQLTVMYRFR